MGVIKIEVDAAHTPATAANFLQYVDDKFYDDTIFNRVIADFVIQAGGFTADLRPRRPRAAIKHEGAAAGKNVAGAVAMARVRAPDSATSHFFIDVQDNDRLDWKDAQNPGYCVFGKVIAGMDVVRKIALTPTSVQRGLPDVPVKPVIIHSIRRAPP